LQRRLALPDGILGTAALLPHPHKRREELIEREAKAGTPIEFQERPCMYGIANGKDFKLVPAGVGQQLTMAA